MKQKKAVKVPVILQMEALECGAASLAMILAYYHKWVPLEQLRVRCGVSRDGSNAWGIVKAAQSYGMDFKANRYSLEHLEKKCTYPAIIFWNQNHFVVLDGFKGKYALINDPASGRVRVEIDVFLKSYSGLCLEFSPTDKFVADGKRKGTFDYLGSAMKGNMRVMLLVMLTAFLAVISGILTPVFSRVYTDNILSGARSGWFDGFILFFSAIIAFQLIASIIHVTLIRKITGKLAVKANTSFMWHLFRMPMEFFSQRSAGDLAGRQAANDTVANTVVGELAPTLINLIMLVFYLTVMFRYSVVLTLAGLLTIILNLFVVQLISQKRIEITRTQMRDQSKLDATTVFGISMIETIKAAGAEEGYMERWSGYHASVNRAKVRISSVNKYLGTLPGLLQQLSSIIVMIVGIASILRGYISVGVFLAFQSFMTAFMNPVNQLLQTGQSLGEMRTSIERIDDVMNYPEDVQGREFVSEDEIKNAVKLSGKVELKNVTFGYSRREQPLIENFSLTLEQGQRVALVGGSGSGKSTIAKLISGLYQPWSGEILFDGKTIFEIPKPVLKSSLAMVDQDVVLFRDTIENNIKMWDETIKDFEMILAARDAEVHDVVIQKKGAYQHLMGEGGHDMSGGEKQRLEIARTLAGDPTIVILDEATSALDALTEYKVSNFIHDRGISCIIVAHRLSTIRDCDEIIVMDNGKVVERGTHKELLQKGSLYKSLIASE